MDWVPSAYRPLIGPSPVFLPWERELECPSTHWMSPITFSSPQYEDEGVNRETQTHFKTLLISMRDKSVTVEEAKLWLAGSIPRATVRLYLHDCFLQGVQNVFDEIRVNHVLKPSDVNRARETVSYNEDLVYTARNSVHARISVYATLQEVQPGNPPTGGAGNTAAVPDPMGLLEVMRRENASLMGKVSNLEAQIAQILALHGAGATTTRTHVSDTHAGLSGAGVARNNTRAPPPPIFSGSEDGLKIRTWLAQFQEYCKVMRIVPSEMTAFATLCLKDKAAEHWTTIKETLQQQNKDVNDFEVFRFALVEHYIDLATENTVRPRLSRVKQRSSVADYHNRFRDIILEAVMHPLSQPEACSYFRAGLKSSIYEHVMRDSAIRNQQSSLEVVVRAAKEAEALFDVLAGHSEDSLRSPQKTKRALQSPQLRDDKGKKPKPANSKEGIVGMSDKLLALSDSLEIPRNVAYARFRANKCLKCDKKGHTLQQCREGDSRATSDA